jgi:hypothetical protein
MSITVIGDVHGKYNEYYNIVSKVDYSVQLGDMGFSSTWNRLNYSDLDPEKHKVCCGNHCDMDIAPNIPHYLGNYGIHTLNGITFFFIRGGLSIDRVYRVGEELNGGPKSWWSQEELNFPQMTECLNLYKRLKPDIVLSHVPCGVYTERILGNKSDAILRKFKFHAGFKENHQLLGNEMLKYHKPKIWVSGHMHKSFQGVIDGVNVVALAELETYEIKE